MKKLIIFLLCTAILCGGGYFGYRQYEKSRDEKKIVDVVPVALMAQPAEYMTMSDSSMRGTVSAANAQKIYVDTEKLVQQVCVEKGQKVKKGDVILEYDMTVVELELQQKENQLQVAEQDIKMAKKELAEMKTYRPSEEMPVTPDEPFIPDEPEFPEEPEQPEIPAEPEIPDQPEEPPVVTVTDLGAGFQPESGNGTPEDPFVINCNLHTAVHRPFMTAIASGNRTVQLRVYDDDSEFLYMWLLDGSSITPADADDWNVTDGLNVNEETGTVSLVPGAAMHGQLSFAMPRRETPQEPDTPEQPEEQTQPEEPEFSEMPEEQYIPEEYDIPETPDADSNDYVYSRSELARMVREKESEIKNLEIELQKSKLALESARKQKSDGRVLAEIDGVVKKIGKPADAAVEEEAEEELDEKNPFAEPEPDENAFAVIEGDGGIEVHLEVAELNLPKCTPGTKLDVTNYMDGSYTEAEVVSVDPEPAAYSPMGWGDNPQNSTYLVHAKLTDPEQFSIGDYVSAEVQKNDSKDNSENYYIPVHYVRRDGGDYYVMRANDDNRLERMYIGTGGVMYGMFIEITGGLKQEDRICFPYGKDVKEGVRTQDSDEILYPSSY